MVVKLEVSLTVTIGHCDHITIDKQASSTVMVYKKKNTKLYLPNVRLPSGGAGRPLMYGLQWWAHMSLPSANVLVGIGLSASAIKLQDACVLGILNGPEMIWEKQYM